MGRLVERGCCDGRAGWRACARKRGLLARGQAGTRGNVGEACMPYRVSQGRAGSTAVDTRVSMTSHAGGAAGCSAGSSAVGHAEACREACWTSRMVKTLAHPSTVSDSE